MTPAVRFTWDQFFQGRDRAYARDLTVEISRNAQHTIEVLNRVLMAAAIDDLELTGLHLASGWRPPGVNAATSNAAHNSPHLTGEAGDVGDLPDRRFARWCLANLDTLKSCGVRAMERPQWCPTWVHLQTRPLESGHFLFIPSSAPALVAALPGEPDDQPRFA